MAPDPQNPIGIADAPRAISMQLFLWIFGPTAFVTVSGLGALWSAHASVKEMLASTAGSITTLTAQVTALNDKAKDIQAAQHLTDADLKNWQNIVVSLQFDMQKAGVTQNPKSPYH